MSLIRSAQINGHDPIAYVKDILTRLSTHRASTSQHCCRITGSLSRLSLIHRLSRQVRWPLTLVAQVLAD
ncbi:transposase [Caballeronia grimmiae]|uniref:Transposase n=1 Tax=Caballeronia grimmiae TaxID=1071679 RepID=A0A069NDS2_9BURK|nr:transposase [Caballeronia grimmiae]